jgi:hypothetical protein
MAPMPHVVLLALGAAVFPLLIACVAIIISRPSPRRLLLGFYAGGMVTSITAGILVLDAFKDSRKVAGSSSSHVSAGPSIAVGLVALALAWLMASRRGRALIERRRARHPRPARDDTPSWAERHLAGASAGVAFAVGAVINLPGPFYLVALGEIAGASYSRAQELGLILLFNVIMFLLLEVPLVGYLVQPERTAERVAALSAWLNANGLRVMGWLVGLVGLSLIAQGIGAAAS